MDVPLFFYIAFKDMLRLAPGSDTTTIKSLNRIETEDISNILDVGCGRGADTLLLADYFKNATVEAIDLFSHYIEVLNENSSEGRIFTYEMNMNDLDFANEEFDLVFSHASAYIIGFKRALREWKRLLKLDGYMIISDVTWLKKPSKESGNFWKNTYDEIDTVESKIAQITDEGYEFIDCVYVSKNEWDNYYKNLESNLNSLNSDKSAKDFVKGLKKEIKVFRQNSDDYTYVFYIMRKANHQ